MKLLLNQILLTWLKKQKGSTKSKLLWKFTGFQIYMWHFALRANKSKNQDKYVRQSYHKLDLKKEEKAKDQLATTPSIHVDNIQSQKQVNILSKKRSLRSWQGKKASNLLPLQWIIQHRCKTSFVKEKLGTNEPRHSKTILDFHGHTYSKVIDNKPQRGRNINLYFGTINKGHKEFHQDRTLFTYS